MHWQIKKKKKSAKIISLLNPIAIAMQFLKFSNGFVILLREM